MPDPALDTVDPAIREELDGLRLLVEKTDGSVIAFVRYRRVTEREAGVRYLKEQLSLPVAERVLSEERQNPLNLLDNLPDERRCVQFYDLEEALPEVTGYLNINREAYAEVPHALVFWVGEHGLREVATNAPDFWAWRSGVFDVQGDEKNLLQSVTQMALADNVRFTNRGDLERRAKLYEELVQEYEENDEEYVVQLRLKLLGIFYWLRRLERAKNEAQWVKEYAERENKGKIAAHVYHSLGRIAEQQWEIEEAEDWYRKSLDIRKNLEDKHGVAATYHQLGMVAEKRGDLEEAEEWYRKALKTFENLGNEHWAAVTCNNLGSITQEKQKLKEAERWYRKALEVFKEEEDEYREGGTYHNLGVVAQKERELQKAEKWYRKALNIRKRLGDEEGTAETYHQLGSVAQEQKNLKEAEELYRRALELKERLDDEHGTAMTYGQYGRLARERGNLLEAGQWFLKAIRGFTSASDDKRVKQAVFDFLDLFDEVSSNVQDDLRQQWIEAGYSEDKFDDLLDQAHAEQDD